MPRPLPFKIYSGRSYDNTIPYDFQVGAWPNTPYGYSETTLEDFNKNATQKQKDTALSGINRQYGQNYSSIDQAFGGTSGMFDTYTSPLTGEVLRNVSQSQIDDLEKQAAGIKNGTLRDLGNGLTVPVGSAADLNLQNPTNVNLTPAASGSTGGLQMPGASGGLYLAADGRTVTDAQGNYVSLDQYKQMTGQTNVPDASLNWSYVTKSPAPSTQGGTTGGSTLTGTLPSTGDPKLDALRDQLKAIQDQMAANGKIINPKIELTPADLQQFYDQAVSEVSPYYASQIQALKGDLTTNLKYLTDQYKLKTQSDQAAFQKNLGDTRENLAGAGLSFSGVRGQQEQAIQADQQNSLDSAANTAAKNAADAVSQTAKQTGSSNLLDLSPPSLSGYTADLSGKGIYNPTRTLNYFNPGTTTGSLQYGQAGAIQSENDFLKQQEVRKRTLSFGG